MGNYFVQPDTRRLELSDGAWIEVKTELSFGEQQRLAGRIMRSKDGNIGTAWEEYRIQGMVAWITDWSLTDMEGQIVGVSRAAIENLRQPIADEIDEVLQEHIAEVTARLDEEKKRRNLAEESQG